MKKSALCIAMVAAVALAFTAWAKEDKTEQQLRLELDLVDGSCVIGTPGIKSVPVQTSYAKMDIPLKQILTLKMGEDHETASLDLQNGDKLKGVINLEPIKLETVFGKVAIGTEYIKDIRVMPGGPVMPPGEGPLSFGGINWTPWRTMFEVQGDKLVSLPKARPGFNYGHGGNGRGATLRANIGSKDWKDYSVEFEFGMRGVDPAFNPHGLPLDYRSGNIVFHVADAKESWNETGESLYNLGFAGDGSWNLTCGYNFRCAVQSGHGNPISDGSRTLAEGKDLKHDPKTGNKIRIDVRGTHIQIWVDGEKIVDVRDEKMREAIGGQTLDHGGIGFNWGFESMGWIRNFSAKRL